MQVVSEHEALAHLDTMKSFCTQLQSFIASSVPKHGARLQDYSSTACIENDARWMVLLRATRDLQRRPYMFGIPSMDSPLVKKQALSVAQLALRT
jgi:hypothetical protein